MVSTADPEKEPPLVTANVILSVLAVNYPTDKVACYLSDDGAAMLTFEALTETANFARLWVPFCRKHSIEPRAPEMYFSHTVDYVAGKVNPDFVRERRSMKRLYDEFKVRVNALVAKSQHAPRDGWRMTDGSPWPGNNRGDHPGMIQVFLDPQGETRDATGAPLPYLVYVSREKRPGYEHNKKAGAMNALMRVSALITNAPFILNLDCDHYVNNSNAIREAVCFLVDPLKGSRVAFVQFPQRFDGVDKNDRYANHNTVFYDVNMKGLDGLQGPMYVGTGCMFRRQALYGFAPPPKAKLRRRRNCCCCCPDWFPGSRQHAASKHTSSVHTHSRAHAHAHVHGLGDDDDDGAPLAPLDSGSSDSSGTAADMAPVHVSRTVKRAGRGKTSEGGGTDVKRSRWLWRKGDDRSVGNVDGGGGNGDAVAGGCEGTVPADEEMGDAPQRGKDEESKGRGRSALSALSAGRRGRRRRTAVQLPQSGAVEMTGPKPDLSAGGHDGGGLPLNREKAKRAGRGRGSNEEEEEAETMQSSLLHGGGGDEVQVSSSSGGGGSGGSSSSLAGAAAGDGACGVVTRWHVRHFGPCHNLLLSTLDVDGGHMASDDAREVLSDVILVISCGFEDSTDWGKACGWMYGSVTEDIVTGNTMHVRGWRSIYCMPKRPAFKGSAPINLTDRLAQVLRWATGSVEICFGQHNPMWADWCTGLGLVQRFAYINTVVYPFTSVALTVYCLLPAVSLFTGQFIVANITNWAVLYFLALFVAIFCTALLEIRWSGVTLEEWWRNEQFWVIGGTSAHLAAVLQGLLKVVAGIDVHFTLTAKGSDSDDELAELYTVRWTWLFLVPLTIMIVNAIAILAGVARAMSSWTPEQSASDSFEPTAGYGIQNARQQVSVGRLMGELFFALWVLLHLYPFLKGLMGRSHRMPTLVIVWSMLLAIIMSLVWSRLSY